MSAQSTQLAERLADATYTAFERIIDLAIGEDVDFVVISGDLYDRESRSVRANEFAVTQFERLAEASIPAYVCYGNHDPVESATTYFDLPENVHEFGAEAAEEVTYPPDEAPKARLWGQSYRSRSDDRKMPYHYTPDEGSLPTIGVVHTGLNPDGRKYVPCSVSDLVAKTGIDYWALGHIHQPRIENETPPVVYPGNPQGRMITEPGVGGCLLVELEGNRSETAFVPVSPIIWQRVTVPVGETADAPAIENGSDLEARLCDALYSVDDDFGEGGENHSFEVERGGWEPEGYVCRWELVGRAPIREVIAADREVLDVVRERLREEADHPQPFVWTEGIRDRTRRPLPEKEEMEPEDRVLTEFERVLETVREEEAAREELRGVVGEIWYEPDESEEERPTELALTDEKYEELLSRAAALAGDELLARRV